MHKEKIKSTNRKIQIVMWIFGILVVFSLLIAAICANFFMPFTDDSFSKYGTVLAGLVTPMISLASGLLVYVAFLGQRLESYQRQYEVDRTNENTISMQFENLFVSLMSFHSDNRKEISGVTGDDECLLTGRLFFKGVYDELKNEYDEVLKKNKTNPETAISHAYSEVYERHQAVLGHFFRYLYNIVRFIDESEVKDKQKYANILRAQLSTYESLLLFYNCLHHKGKRKFNPLLVKYHLLESLNKDKLLSNSHVDLYDIRAYGNRNKNNDVK